MSGKPRRTNRAIITHTLYAVLAHMKYVNAVKINKYHTLKLYEQNKIEISRFYHFSTKL